ncbi:MAG TPA: hypothetical protein VHM19_19595, partial [Polyangiales bacterium]|nr:hypothetical protein [Polyangiales bacterium]
MLRVFSKDSRGARRVAVLEHRPATFHAGNAPLLRLLPPLYNRPSTIPEKPASAMDVIAGTPANPSRSPHETKLGSISHRARQ